MQGGEDRGRAVAPSSGPAAAFARGWPPGRNLRRAWAGLLCGVVLTALGTMAPGAVTAAAPAQPTPMGAPAPAPAPAASGGQPGAAAPHADRPRIGLVLSGGGARGGAHIGVLRVLERLNVPVDVIVGTSAGSIVGAAYATGMPLATIEDVMGELNTAMLFRDVQREDVPIERRSDDQINAIGPEIGIGPGGVSLPKGAVAGVALEAVLRKLTVRQRDRNFDRLPIPFRAVATDLSDASMVVLGQGSLSAAIRASMAIPAVVNPVEIDGHLLVDGGLVRNLPVDVARRLGADIIIAVNLGTPLRTRNELTSVLTVTDQMTRMLTNSNVQQSLSELTDRDLVITPQLGTISSADFDRLPEAAAAGEAAAMAAVAGLQQYAIEPAAYATWAARRTGETEQQVRPLAEVRVEGAERVNDAVVRAQMRSRVGEPFDAETAEADLRRIYALGDFEHVSYYLDDTPGTAGPVLTTELHEKSWGPNYLRFGLALSTDFEGNSFFTLRGVHRRPWLNAWGGEWRNDLQIGHSDHLYTGWRQPIGPTQQFFVDTQLGFARTPFDIYNDGTRLARFRRESYEAAVEGGMRLGSIGQVSAGLSRSRHHMLTDTSLFPGSLLVPRADNGGYTGRLLLDTLDNPRFPRRGYVVDLEGYAARKALGADYAYTRVSAKLQAAYAWHAHSLQFVAEAVDTLGNNALPNYDLVQLGGFQRVSGYRIGELLGRSLRLGRAVYSWRIARPGFFDGAYAGISLEAGRVGDKLSTDQPGTVIAGSVYVAVDTLLGPVYLAWGQAEGGRSAVYFFIGQPP